MMEFWLLFVAAAAVIGLAGPVLSRSASAIADGTRMGQGWIGIILLDTVTSLPELATGLSAVAYWDTPNIAVGDALGSCVFNLAILMVLDSMLRGAPLYTRAHHRHILSAAIGVILMGFAGLSLMISAAGAVPALGHVGIPSLIMAVLYVVGIRAVYVQERDGMQAEASAATAGDRDMELAAAYGRYALAAVAIVLAGVTLPYAGEAIAQELGWNRTFVGTLLVAGATSLPELAVAVAAVRIGSLNLAVAGLLGSNMFNMLILAIEDAAYLKGPLFAHVSEAHAVSAMSAVVMTGLVITGLQYRQPRKIGNTVGWISMALFLIYLLNAYLAYLHGQ